MTWSPRSSTFAWWAQDGSEECCARATRPAIESAIRNAVLLTSAPFVFSVGRRRAPAEATGEPRDSAEASRAAGEALRLRDAPVERPNRGSSLRERRESASNPRPVAALRGTFAGQRHWPLAR